MRRWLLLHVSPFSRPGDTASLFLQMRLLQISQMTSVLVTVLHEDGQPGQHLVRHALTHQR